MIKLILMKKKNCSRKSSPLNHVILKIFLNKDECCHVLLLFHVPLGVVEMEILLCQVNVMPSKKLQI